MMYTKMPHSQHSTSHTTVGEHAKNHSCPVSCGCKYLQTQVPGWLQYLQKFKFFQKLSALFFSTKIGQIHTISVLGAKTQKSTSHKRSIYDVNEQPLVLNVKTGIYISMPCLTLEPLIAMATYAGECDNAQCVFIYFCLCVSDCTSVPQKHEPLSSFTDCSLLQTR